MFLRAAGLGDGPGGPRSRPTHSNRTQTTDHSLAAADAAKICVCLSCAAARPDKKMREKRTAPAEAFFFPVPCASSCEWRGPAQRQMLLAYARAVLEYNFFLAEG